MREFCWLLACTIPLLAGAAEIPERVLPAGVGVNIHFITGHKKDLDLIAAAGIKFVRMELYWDKTEPQIGEYEWLEYDELVTHLEQRGLRPLFILGYGNPLYEPIVTATNSITHRRFVAAASPRHPESVAAYALWAAAAAKHFQGRHVIWELWNEPNITFWIPHPDVRQYAELALATCKAMREADPEATIIAPAASEFPWQFLETLFQSGVLAQLDAISVHPYRNYERPPETAAADYQRLRALIERYAPPEKKNAIPILSGEWGYASPGGDLLLEIQGQFAARQQLSNLLNGIPLSIWYDWKNDGSNPYNNEHNFGTVLPDLTPKPAYLALRTLTHQLSGYHIARRLALPNQQDYVLLCANAAGEHKLAAWTLGEPHAVNLQISARGVKRLAAAKCTGESFTVNAFAGRLMLEVTSAPQYVTLGDAVVTSH